MAMGPVARRGLASQTAGGLRDAAVAYITVPMGYVLSKFVAAMLTPGAVLFAGLAVGVLLLWTRRWRAGRVVLSLLAAGFAALVLTPVDSTLTKILEDRFPGNPPLPARIDGIIVLGGSVNQYISAARHQISVNDSSERLFQTVLLAKAHPEARVLFTGGAADPLRPDPREAPFAAELLVKLGVDPARLVVEDQSRNTFENAVFSQRQAAPRKGETWVLVTSARHMPRSVGVFRHVGWPVIPWPVDYATDGGTDWANADLPVTRLERLTKALHEWFGLAFYRLSGWTDSLFPAP